MSDDTALVLLSIVAIACTWVALGLQWRPRQ